MRPRDYGSGPSRSRQYEDSTRPSHALAYKKSVEEYFLPSTRFHPVSPSFKSLQKSKTLGTATSRASNQDVTTARYPDPSHRRPDSGSRQSTKNTFQWIKGELIGQGSHGKVYLGFNATTGELMAVKQVEIPVTADDRRKAELADFVQTLRQERETLRYLDHPNIVQYLRFEENKHTVNIFLQYISGGTVGRCLKEYGPFKEEVTKSFTRQILEGIRYLHSSGIIHRDLKSENILVEPAGVCKISDFGIAKKLELARAYSKYQGTYYWMAPEVLDRTGTGYDSKVDIWSVGCIVFEMWTAKRPWHEEENVVQVLFKLAEKKTPPLPEGLDLSMSAEDFRNECLEPNPSKRPAAEFLLSHPYLQLPQGWSFPGIPNMGIRSNNGGSPLSEITRTEVGSYTIRPSNTRSRSFSSASSLPLPNPPRTISPPLVIIAPPPPRKLPTPQTPVYSRDRSFSVTSESSESQKSSQASSPSTRRRLYIHNPEATPDFVKPKTRDLPRPPTAKPFVYVPPPLPDLDSYIPYSNSLAPLPKLSIHNSTSNTRRENAVSERPGPLTSLWGQSNPSTLSLPTTLPRQSGPANLEEILSVRTSMTTSDYSESSSQTVDTSYSGWQRPPPPRQPAISPRRRPSLPPTPTQRNNLTMPISTQRQSTAFGGVTRPDNREVLEHMKVYFPDHDLDEPVASSPIDAVFSSSQEMDLDVVLSRRLTLKSIKDIAEEKIHRDLNMTDKWRQTRLWDSEIEEIKPQK